MSKLNCAECRDRLLDLEYGLLDAKEVAALTAHLASCPACQGAAANAKRTRGLFAAAAKSAFPDTTFTPPSTEPSSVRTQRYGGSKMAPMAWLPMALSACIAFVVLAWAASAIADTAGYAWNRKKVDSELETLKGIESEKVRLQKQIDERHSTANENLNLAKDAYDKAEKQWISAEAKAVEKLNSKPFLLNVRGPATATPGAPNDYQIRILQADGNAVKEPVKVEATVKDSEGNELLSTSFNVNSANEQKLHIPSGVWSKVSAGREVFLSLSATDKSGAKSDLTENLRMLEPVFTTFLTTDKPMYRPGESVYYRTLTLDRANFRAPERDMNVRFEIVAPSGQVLNGSQVVGLARAGKVDAQGQLQPMLGPDGKPIRGIGSGAFALPGELVGGEYTLNAYEVPSAAGERLTSSTSGLLASRKFIVNNYTPDKLLKKLEFDGKSYGPGDTVQAKFDLKDMDKPLAAKIEVTAEADGQAIKLDVAPTTTEADGTANIKFTLPKVEEIKQARVSVKVSTPAIIETKPWPIPLTTRKLNVEFFPEGGDLIAGVSNRVYFRATTTTGKPADVVGQLKVDGKEVTAIRTLTDAEQPGANQGMGSFEFTPELGKNYSVALEKPLGLLQPEGGYKLPEAKKSGVVLNVANGVSKPGEPIIVKLTSVGEKRNVLVGAYVRGRSVGHVKATLEAGVATEAKLDLGTTPMGGVTRITVFDLPGDDLIGREDLTPLAERLVFRTNGEQLKLSFAARKAGGGAHTGAFVPGARVDLDVTSTDESGKAKPAILWAAVVNQSVITMADEKIERNLPTHFLLGGEVQKGEELEHADFLLTDHKKASVALDLLLGTQGWRRFAEQGAEFRKNIPAEEADRIFLVSASMKDIPTGWRPTMRKVFDEFWPAYESALLNVENAEKNHAVAFNTGNDEADRGRAEAEYQTKLAQFAKTSVDLKKYDEAWTKRRNTLGAILAGLLGLMVLSIALGRSVYREVKPARAALFATAALLGLATLLVGGFAIWTGMNNEKWRETAAKAKEQFPEVVKMRVEAGDKDAPEGFAMKNAMPAPAMNAKMPAGGPGGGGFMGGGGGLGGGAMQKRGGFGDPKEEKAKGVGGGEDKFNKNAFEQKADGKPMDGIAPPRPMAKMMAPRAVGPGMPAGGGRPAGGPGGRPEMPGGPPAMGGFAGDVRGGGGRDLAEGRRGGRFALPEMDRERMGNMGRPAINGQGLNRLDDFVNKREEQLGAARKKSKDTKGVMDALAFEGLGIQQFLPQYQPLVVREYAHARPELTDDTPRTDFTETLLWQPMLVTAENGKATVTFSLADDVAPYRVLVAGHSLDGRIGSVSGVLEVRKAFALDPKLPVEIGSSDKVDVPLIGLNGTDGTRTAEVKMTTVGLKVVGPEKVQIDLNGTNGGRKLVRMIPEKLDGEMKVQLDGKVGPDSDSISRTMTVVADGFPASGQKSDLLESKLNATFKLPEMVIPGTLKMKVAMYPNTLSEVQSGLASLLREPNGCFEQTSTTNYPNVLVMDYLNETNQAKPEISKQAKGLMERGYAKLISYECQKERDGREGYEWFGGATPPHEALSAYGLLQFTDMARVYPVDAAMMARTKKYLIDSRDGKGGFKKNARALDTFGYAPAHLNDAYIVWALTESEAKSETKTDLKLELAAMLKRATGDNAKDPYYVGLVANSFLNAGDRKTGETLLAALTKMQKNGPLPGAATSITNSQGEALLIESTALAVLGWLKANETGTYRPNIEAACNWIGKQRSSYGGFGSTQSTILALKSLIEFARSSKRPAENGSVRVIVNGKMIADKAFTTEQSGPITVEIPDAETLFADGKVDIKVETDAKQAYPCTVSWECRSRKPDSSAECPIQLSTKLAKSDLQEGDTVRLGVSVKNTKAKQNGMVTAIVGIPAGLKIPEDMKQLKLLTDKPKDGQRATVSYWEKRGRELVFYWHGLDENQTVEFGIDLIAEIPGEYRGPASRAYLYYGAEHKHWVDPVDVKISAK